MGHTLLASERAAFRVSSQSCSCLPFSALSALRAAAAAVASCSSRSIFWWRSASWLLSLWPRSLASCTSTYCH